MALDSQCATVTVEGAEPDPDMVVQIDDLTGGENTVDVDFTMTNRTSRRTGGDFEVSINGTVAETDSYTVGGNDSKAFSRTYTVQVADGTDENVQVCVAILNGTVI